MNSIHPADESSPSFGRAALRPVHKRRLLAWIAVFLAAVVVVSVIERSASPPGFVYSVYPSKIAIYKSGEPSKLKILIDSQRVEGDVSSIEIGFWNRGNKVIRMADAPAGIRIQSDGSHPIYFARLVREVNGVSGLRLDSSQQANGIIGLSWDSLKKGEGGIVQIIYGGSSEWNPSVGGLIEGQNGISKVELKNVGSGNLRGIEPALFNRGFILEVVLFFLIFSLFAAYLVYAIVQVFKIRNDPAFGLTVMVEAVTVMLFLAAIWLVVYFALQSHPLPGAPLDF